MGCHRLAMFPVKDMNHRLLVQVTLGSRVN